MVDHRALQFVLTVGDPLRFRKSRDIGPYIGLVPKKQQSGDVDKQMRISKAANHKLRSLLRAALLPFVETISQITLRIRESEKRLDTNMNRPTPYWKAASTESRRCHLFMGNRYSCMTSKAIPTIATIVVKTLNRFNSAGFFTFR